MALLQPSFILELVQSLKHSLRTYPVGSMRVGQVSCKVDLMRLYLLEKADVDVYILLCPLAFLDASSFIERKV